MQPAAVVVSSVASDSGFLAALAHCGPLALPAWLGHGVLLSLLSLGCSHVGRVRHMLLPHCKDLYCRVEKEPIGFI